MRRYSGLVLTISMFVVTALPAAGDSPFADDDGNIHEQAIARAADLGITKGCNPPQNDRYCPDRTVTRGEFAAFLVRALGLPAPQNHSFSDISGNVFEGDVAALAASGITKGCNPPDNTRFCPERRLSRGELAALLSRALELPKASEDYFADDDGGVFEGDINRLAAAGITKGCGGERYCADRNLPRDEMASFLVRMLSGGGEPPPPRGEEPPGPGSSAPSNAVPIRPSDNPQKIVNAHGAGTAFLLKSGTHRQFSVEPKNGNSFYGEGGTVLSGARTLTDFGRSDGAWVARGQTQQRPFTGKCESGTACQMAEGVWMDGKELRQVTSRSALKPGTFYFDYGGDAIYLADDPRGRLVEASVEQHAFTGDAGNVSIVGLVIEKYANPAQTGSIHPRDGSNGPFGHDWSLLGNEIRHNHGEGLKLGPGMLAKDNFIHRNGRLGVHGSSTKLNGAWVTGNEISHNCTGEFQCSGWGGGGVKIGSARNVVLENNYIHHNRSVGLHSDVGAVGITVKGNVISDNYGSGVVIEITYGATVTGNKIDNNGFEEGKDGAVGAGILVRSSPDVRVIDNAVINNYNGVLAIQIDRGTGPHGPFELENLSVENNLIVMREGFTGVRETEGDPSYFSSRNNRFKGNTYELGPNRYYYKWDGLRLTRQEWINAGHDVDGEWR